MAAGLHKKTLWFVIGGIGYILSPLSWWNDLYVNIPISYFAASLAHRANPVLFLPVLTGAYWLTNIVGLVLLYMGGKGTMTGTIGPMSGKALLRWLLFSVLYTIAIVLGHEAGWIQPLEQYFRY